MSFFSVLDAAVGDFEALHCQPAQKHDSSN